MNALPEAAPREAIHERNVVTTGFLRADGLWDIEAVLVDRKTYASTTTDGQSRAAGEPVHHLQIRLTIDDTLTVRAAVAAMPNTPYRECGAAGTPVSGLVGVRIGRNWRQEIEAAMGGVRGCTHLREMLNAMATVAIQTVSSYLSYQRRQRGEPAFSATVPGHQMGRCLAWDFNGPVVARIAPQFIGYIPRRQPDSREVRSTYGCRHE